jgi:hypothetical protein
MAPSEVAMTLAFYPLGAFLAGLFLGSAVTLFAVAVRLLDQAATRSGRAMLPGLVTGFRDWSERRREPRIVVSPAAVERETSEPDDDLSGPEIIDLS